MASVLLAENDLNLSQTIAQVLESKGYQVSCVKSISRLDRLTTQSQFDLLILDRMLMDGDVLDFLPFLAEQLNNARILAISQKGQTEDKVRGFDCGVNDYLAKSFSLKEFLLRVNNLLNLVKPLDRAVLKLNNWQYYPSQALFLSDRQQVYLPAKENQLFQLLLRFKGQILSKNKIKTAMWTDADDVKINTLDVYVRRLRVKLAKIGGQIKTYKGMGYQIKI